MASVLCVNELHPYALCNLLTRYALRVVEVASNQSIPGSFWGEPEAGLMGDVLYVRADTPVHSALHESSHYICMDIVRRKALHTNAGGDEAEENGVCYLQILLAEYLPPMTRARMFQDMDAWGYSFRFGSAQSWFEQDAEDARIWLQQHALIDPLEKPLWCLRGE